MAVAVVDGISAADLAVCVTDEHEPDYKYRIFYLLRRLGLAR